MGNAGSQAKGTSPTADNTVQEAVAPPPPATPKTPVAPPQYSHAEGISLISSGLDSIESVFGASGQALPGTSITAVEGQTQTTRDWPPMLPASSDNKETRPLPVRGGWLPRPNPGDTRDVAKWCKLMSESFMDYLDALQELTDEQRGARKQLLKRLHAVLDAAERVISTQPATPSAAPAAPR